MRGASGQDARLSPARGHHKKHYTSPMAKQDEPNKVIYSMVGVGKIYGQKQVLKDIYLGYFYGAKIGVIGLNGSGKSTLLRIMAGVETAFIGQVAISPGYTVGYLEQEPKLDPAKTVMDVVKEGAADTVALLAEFEAISDKFSEPMDGDEMEKLLERQGNVQERLDALDAWDLDSRLELAMDALRCPPGDTPVSVLSGGELRRVALCRLLLQKPDILLLDEPTNHLDAETVQWLEQHLQRYEGTVIAVTHDRYFLDNVAGWILELDRGRGIPYEGNYTAYLDAKAKRLRQEGREDDARQKSIAREREWIASSPKARQSKSKARIKAFEDLLQAAESRRPTDTQIVIPHGERLGNVVIEVDGLSKGFGDQLLIEDLTFKLPPGGIVGIIGPNGAGKTTLFRMITGQEKPDAGSIRVGETVKLGYVDQSRDTLDPSKTVWEEISGGAEVVKLGKHDANTRAYCSSFNFRGQDQQQKVGNLSGGQRNRVHLAKMLRTGGNVLLLDEPTNDLDTETLSALEDALENFAGCAVIISHDRMFLDRMATHILAFEGDSHVEWFEGNFEDYEKDKVRRLGADALNPHRMTYKRLTR